MRSINQAHQYIEKAGPRGPLCGKAKTYDPDV